MDEIEQDTHCYEDELKESNGNLLDFTSNIIYKLQKYINRFCIEMKKIKIYEAEEGNTDINKLLNFLVIETDNIFIRKCIDFVYEYSQLLSTREDRYAYVISTNKKNMKFYIEAYDLINSYRKSIDFFDLSEDDYEHAELIDYSCLNYEDEFDKHLKMLRENIIFKEFDILSYDVFLSILNSVIISITSDLKTIISIMCNNKTVQTCDKCCRVVIEYMAIIYYAFSYIYYA